MQLTDTPQSMIVKMCEGNPGALRVLLNCVTQGAAIDPDHILGGIAPILELDELGLYGSNIWILYKDVCKEDLPDMIAMLRAWQLGFVERTKILHAVENYGEGIDVAALRVKVEEKLPNFHRSSLLPRQVEADKSPVV